MTIMTISRNSTHQKLIFKNVTFFFKISRYRKFYHFVIYLKGRYETLPDNISLYTSSGDSLRYIIYFWKKREKEKDYFKTAFINFKLFVYYRRHINYHNQSAKVLENSGIRKKSVQVCNNKTNINNKKSCISK